MEVSPMSIYMVNNLKRQLSDLCRSIERAVSNDGKIDTWEGMALGMKSMQLGTQILAMMKTADAQTLREITYIVEHGEFSLPQPMAPQPYRQPGV